MPTHPPYSNSQRVRNETAPGWYLRETKEGRQSSWWHADASLILVVGCGNFSDAVVDSSPRPRGVSRWPSVFTSAVFVPAGV